MLWFQHCLPSANSSSCGRLLLTLAASAGAVDNSCLGVQAKPRVRVAFKRRQRVALQAAAAPARTWRLDLERDLWVCARITHVHATCTCVRDHKDEDKRQRTVRVLVRVCACMCVSAVMGRHLAIHVQKQRGLLACPPCPALPCPVLLQTNMSGRIPPAALVS